MSVEAFVRVDYRGRFAQENVRGGLSPEQAISAACKRVLAKWKRIPDLATDGGQSVVVQASWSTGKHYRRVELTLPWRGARDGDKSTTRHDYSLPMSLQCVAMLDELARAVRAEGKR